MTDRSGPLCRGEMNGCEPLPTRESHTHFCSCTHYPFAHFHEQGGGTRTSGPSRFPLSSFQGTLPASGPLPSARDRGSKRLGRCRQEKVTGFFRGFAQPEQVFRFRWGRRLSSTLCSSLHSSPYSAGLCARALDPLWHPAPYSVLADSVRRTNPATPSFQFRRLTAASRATKVPVRNGEWYAPVGTVQGLFAPFAKNRPGGLATGGSEAV
jgi:hypothetical protein